MNWNQPCCDDCWVRMNEDRLPFRLTLAERKDEDCAWCGMSTTSGIYVRADPATVPFPATEDDE